MATPPDVLAERARTVAGHAHVLEEGWKWKGAVAALRAHLGDDSKIQAALTTIIKKQNCGVNGEYTVGRATPLLTACVMGNTGDATMLLEFGANPTHVGAVWDRFHHYKDAAGGKTAATTSVTTPKCDIHPLGVAAREGRAEIVKILLAHKDVDVNQASESGTALSLACAANQMDVVKMLLEADGIVLIGGGITALPAVPAAAMNSPPKKEITAPSPFQVACCYNRIEIVKMLIETAGVDVNDEAALPSVLSPLAIACQQGYFELVKLLLTNSCVDVNRGSSDPLGMTPLCFACQRKDNMVMIKMLLAHSKIFVNGSLHKTERSWFCDLLPTTPLVIACNNNDANLVELLLAQDNIDVNKAAKLIWERGGFSRYQCDEISPLFLASGNGNEKIVRLLLQADGITLYNNGCWPGEWSYHQDPFGYGGTSPVYIACCNGHIEVARLLLKATGYGVDHYPDQFDETLPPEALLVACRRNDTNLIQLLLEHGVDPNARDHVKDCWGRGWGDERLAEEVRDAGMAPIENEEDPDYDERELDDFDWGTNYPLHYAAEHGNLRAVQLLVVYGAITWEINHLGNTPCEQARLTGNGDVATFLNATKDWGVVEVAAACRLYGVIVRQVRNDKPHKSDRSSIFAKAHAKPDELPW